MYGKEDPILSSIPRVEDLSTPIPLIEGEFMVICEGIDHKFVTFVLEGGEKYKYHIHGGYPHGVKYLARDITVIPGHRYIARIDHNEDIVLIKEE